VNRWLLHIFVSVTLVVPLQWFAVTEESRSGDYSSLSFAVNYVYRTAGVGQLKTIENGDALQSGDHYKIVFTPDKDCYVYIFQVDSSGQIFQLFPMKSFQGVEVNNFNPVKPDRTYVIPSPDKAFVLDKVVGVERIYFIASDDRDEQLENLYLDWQRESTRKQPKQSEKAKDKLNKYFKKRGIVVAARSNQSLQVSWDGSGDTFSVVNQRLEDLSKDNMHVLEFFHR
jgi:hypothetical protein